MKHICSYQKFELVQETYNILEGRVSTSELQEIINEGFLGFIKGLFVDAKTKRTLDKLADELFKTKVELMKLEIEEDQVDSFKDELKAAQSGEGYSETLFDTSDFDRVKQAKISSLQDKESAISDQMDNLGQLSDKLQQYVNKIKLEVRIKATDATIRIADAEISRVLQKLKQVDTRQSQQIQRELQ